MSANDAAKARLLDAVRAERSPTRPEIRRYEVGRLVMGLAVGALLVVGLGGVHARERPLILVLESAAAWGGIAMAATYLALRRGRTMLGIGVPWLIVSSLLVVPLLGASWFCVPWRGVPTAPHSFVDDSVCFVLTLLLTAGPLVAFVGLRREGDPVHPGLTGAVMGVAAGAWGATLIDLHCENIGGAHVIVGHIIPSVAALFVGAAWARSALAIRRDA